MGIGLIEKIQTEATKTPHSMKILRYEARQVKWEINKLEFWSLIGMYKLMSGLNKLNWDSKLFVTPKDRVLTKIKLDYEIKLG